MQEMIIAYFLHLQSRCLNCLIFRWCELQKRKTGSEKTRKEKLTFMSDPNETEKSLMYLSAPEEDES